MWYCGTKLQTILTHIMWRLELFPHNVLYVNKKNKKMNKAKTNANTCKHKQFSTHKEKYLLLKVYIVCLCISVCVKTF